MVSFELPNVKTGAEGGVACFEVDAPRAPNPVLDGVECLGADNAEEENILIRGDLIATVSSCDEMGTGVTSFAGRDG